MDTIFALATGGLPSALAVMRISGPMAFDIAEQLVGRGRLPKPRLASVRSLRDPEDGELIDEALVLCFKGPNSSTGEDVCEFHCHGSRGVARRLESVLSRQPELRRAEAGEFTRRAFENGRLGLHQVEALDSLLLAESDLEHRVAARAFDGLDSVVAQWLDTILSLSAQTEAEIDFSDEDDVSRGGEEGTFGRIQSEIAEHVKEWRLWLDRPEIERLHEGFRVVIAGPPNSGKSSLLNRLTREDTAIVSDVAGTTRDIVQASVSINGVPFLLRDTAGLRAESADPIEKIGMDRAIFALAEADCVLWLGREGECPNSDDAKTVFEIAAKSDVDPSHKSDAAIALSSVSGEGLDRLESALLTAARDSLPDGDHFALNRRQRGCLVELVEVLDEAVRTDDILIVAESLRQARHILDRLTGRAGTEDMLDSLFGRFCIGK